jgi:hypothetical protein
MKFLRPELSTAIMKDILAFVIVILSFLLVLYRFYLMGKRIHYQIAGLVIISIGV